MTSDRFIGVNPVYRSSSRPANSSWARADGAIRIGGDRLRQPPNGLCPLDQPSHVVVGIDDLPDSIGAFQCFTQTTRPLPDAPAQTRLAPKSRNKKARVAAFPR